MKTAPVSQAWNPYNTVEEADDYLKHAILEKQRALESLKEQNWMQTAEQVLDIGCGTGNVSFRLKKKVRNGSVIGVDISKSMTTVAKNAFGSIPGLSFQVENAMKLSFADRTFDVTTLFSSLHWIPDPDQALKECRRVLKPGGRIVVVEPNNNRETTPLFNQIKEGLQSIFGALEKPTKIGKKLLPLFQQKSYMAKANLRSALERNGYEQVDVRELHHHVTFSSVEDVKGWVRSSTDWVKFLKEESDRQELTGQLTELFLKIFPPQADGSITIKTSRLEATAFVSKA